MCVWGGGGGGGELVFSDRLSYKTRFEVMVLLVTLIKPAKAG